MTKPEDLEQGNSQQNADAAIQEALTLSGNPDKIKKYYDRWADNYEDDVSQERYQGTEYIVDYFAKLHAQNDRKQEEANINILDAGCGTGLVGIALQKKGYYNVDGCDISDGMVEMAKKTRAYQSVTAGVDLNNMTPYQDEQYDVVISCGVFTQGHVPPTALQELVRVTKKRGLVFLSTRKSYYETTDFQAVCDSLEDEGEINLAGHVVAPYLAEEDAHYWAFEVR